MHSVRNLARSTRRGLFGNHAPARAWESALQDFQDARENLSVTFLDLESFPPDPDDTANRAAWESMLAAVARQMTIMDSTASTLLAGANIANGLENFFPGFQGVSAAGVLGVNDIAAPVAIATLRAMSQAARGIINRTNAYVGKPTPAPGLSGFTPWGSIGGDIWEWWNAEQVQREYEAVGKVPPSIEEIREGALFDIGQRVQEKATAFTDYTRTIIVAGAVIAVVIFLGRK